MRGRQEAQVSMLAFVDLESRVPVGHPMRTIKRLAEAALAELSPLFDEIYAESGRPSIPPERLLKASLLIALYSVRSERAFCEELDYHLLFRWFLDMSLMEPGFDASTFTKNRDRLLKHEVGQRFFDEVVAQAQERKLLSDEHFTVDGTLIEAAASLKSFRRRDAQPSEEPPDDPGNPTVDFHGEKRSNKTHQSTTDPEARLFKKGKGKEAKLCFMGHALMENRHGLLVDFQMTEATGTAERDVTPKLLRQARERGFHPKTHWGRQELRHARLRRRHPRMRRDAARGPEHERAPERHRRPDDTPPRLRRQSADPQAGRGDLRLDEDRRRLPTNPLPRPRAHQIWPAISSPPPTTWSVSAASKSPNDRQPPPPDAPRWATPTRRPPIGTRSAPFRTSTARPGAVFPTITAITGQLWTRLRRPSLRQALLQQPARAPTSSASTPPSAPTSRHSPVVAARSLTPRRPSSPACGWSARPTNFCWPHQTLLGSGSHAPGDGGRPRGAPLVHQRPAPAPGVVPRQVCK